MSISLKKLLTEDLDPHQLLQQHKDKFDQLTKQHGYPQRKDWTTKWVWKDYTKQMKRLEGVVQRYEIAQALDKAGKTKVVNWLKSQGFKKAAAYTPTGVTAQNMHRGGPKGDYQTRGPRVYFDNTKQPKLLIGGITKQEMIQLEKIAKSIRATLLNSAKLGVSIVVKFDVKEDLYW